MKPSSSQERPTRATERVFQWQLEHRVLMLFILLAVTGFFGYFAAGVEIDHSVEHFFPTWSESRDAYDRYKDAFPHEDAQAYVVVQASDIFSREGLRRLSLLEEDLADLPHVIDVDGPMSILDIVDDGMLATETLFPSWDLDDEEIERRKTTATTDRLFKWNLARPDGTAVNIRVTLDPEAVSEARGRMEYHLAAERLIESHHHDGQEIVLSGLPSIRAKFAQGLEQDLGRLVPLGLLVVVLLMFGVYRSVGAALACLLTIGASLVWAQGFQGILGYSITILSSILPILVIVISVSDTAHITNDFFERRRRGMARKQALVEAASRAAWPCLATEVVIACGFLSLLAVNIVGVMQFGLAAAGAMLLTWAANMTVMPLVMSFVRTDGNVRSASGGGAPWTVRAFGRVIEFISVQVRTRPIVVLLLAGAVALACVLTMPHIDRRAFVFDDLYPSSTFYQELRFAEEATGGLVPLAIFVEALDEGQNPVLEPEVVRLMDRAGHMLREFPEFAQALSIADYLRKAHGIFLGDDEEMLERDGLPNSRKLAAQEILIIDDGSMLRDYLTFDRRSAAALGFGLDAGSTRFEEMFEVIDAWVENEQRRFDEDPKLPNIRISATGQMQLFHEVHGTLTGGLVASLAGVISITLIMFFIVFRSFKLGLIGLVPNLMPIFLTVTFMVIAGISLRPMTVIVFSIVLVIAYDDTVQYLARLRRNYAEARERLGRRRPEELTREAIISTLWETGLPLFITSTIVSAGFILLLLSSFEGIAHIGMILAVTLFFALFADLFLAPILVERVKPRLSREDSMDGDFTDEEQNQGTINAAS